MGYMFGLKLPQNFNSPYQSRNIIDFWRRWHMTLSRFLRDYVYIPLGGSRKGSFLRYVNLVLTMLIGGLWHGASWTFVIWGALHGLYLLVNHWVRESSFQGFSKLPFISWLLTYLSVLLGWVFFRAETLTGAKNILMAMLPISEAQNTFPMFLDTMEKMTFLCVLGGSLAIAFFGAGMSRIFLSYGPYYSSQLLPNSENCIWRPSFWTAFILGLIFLCCCLSFSSISTFIYYQF